ncbi:MAG: 3'-5' exonuclease [Bacteroidetes bacterium]|nr:3'-5' exonuclease [Bacteroidota bacterium]
MANRINIEQVLFLDIETVPAWAEYSSVPEPFLRLWDKKAGFICKEGETPEMIYDRAGIYAEFGKIICISSGFFKNGAFRIKSYYGDEEKELLEGFANLLNDHYNRDDRFLCAHNGKEFDFPYISRRMLVNGIDLPEILNMGGKKPWEVPYLDTMEMWRFGDYKQYTSLELLTTLFGIPTPKDDISGADIHRVYWQDHDLERIVKYCQKDVLAIAQLFLKYKNNPLIEEEQVFIVS